MLSQQSSFFIILQTFELTSVFCLGKDLSKQFGEVWKVFPEELGLDDQ